MNEENEPFEQRLAGLPQRPVPADWRADILRAAKAAQAAGPLPVRAKSGWFSVAGHELTAWLWPNPKAWAGLAAVWVLILAVNLSSRDASPQLAEKSAPPTPAMVAELRSQERMFAELVRPEGQTEADRQKVYSPKPRSERREMTNV